MSDVPGSQPPQEPTAPQPPQAPGQPWGWYAGAPHPAVPDHPQATTALVLGLVALVGGLTCLVPLLLGPAAWVVGRRAVRAIDTEPGRWGGRGQAQAGYVLGVVATVVLVLAVVAVTALVLFVVSLPAFVLEQADV